MKAMMVTTTLFNVLQAELIKKGLNEFENDVGEFVFFNKDYQFMQKIIAYDADVSEIMDQLFYGLQLATVESDTHFKKNFLLRFINRQINRQTIEAFQMELMNTFLTNEAFINRVYQDLEKYVTNQSIADQRNNQVNDGTTTTDNRQAFADLPQNTVNINVDDTVMTSASDNTISRNKQTNQQATDGTTTTESATYQLDQLLKTNGIMEHIFTVFDSKCFLQVW